MISGKKLLWWNQQFLVVVWKTGLIGQSVKMIKSKDRDHVLRPSFLRWERLRIKNWPVNFNWYLVQRVSQRHQKKRFRYKIVVLCQKKHWKLSIVIIKLKESLLSGLSGQGPFRTCFEFFYTIFKKIIFLIGWFLFNRQKYSQNWLKKEKDGVLSLEPGKKLILLSAVSQRYLKSFFIIFILTYQK